MGENDTRCGAMSEEKSDIGLEFDFDLSDEAIASLDDYSFLTSESFRSTTEETLGERDVQGEKEDLAIRGIDVEFEVQKKSGKARGKKQTVVTDINPKNDAKVINKNQKKRDVKVDNTVNREEKKKKRRNEAEKLRTKRLNDEFAALSDLFLLPNEKKDKLSKVCIIKKAQEIIKDLREKLQGKSIAKVETSTSNEQSDLIGPSWLPDSFIFANTGLPMAISNVHGVVQFANSSFMRVTGFTEEDIKSKQVGMFSMSTKDDLAEMYQRAGELLSGERQFMFFSKTCRVPSNLSAIFNVSMSIINIPRSKETCHNKACSANAESALSQHFHCTILPVESNQK